MIDDSLYEERRTPKGYLVKVRLAKMTYVVFSEIGPEIPRGAKNNSIVVTVPRIAFLGPDFDLSHFYLGELSFVNVRNGKLVIPYQHGNSSEVKTIFLATGSNSDILPVIIYHFKTPEELTKQYDSIGGFQHVILDEDLSRQSMVTLKIRFPNLNILVIKRKIHLGNFESEAAPALAAATTAAISATENRVVDNNAVRATDLAKSVDLNSFSENPVFLARIHLRNLELDKLKQLLLDFKLTPQDISFIRTFLAVMIKNEFQKPELTALHSKLVSLSEAFRLAGLVLEDKIAEFETELEKGFSLDIANMVYALVVKEEEESKDETKAIILWEWRLHIYRSMYKNI